MGPGSVLAGLVKRIVPGAETASISEPAALTALAARGAPDASPATRSGAGAGPQAD